MSDQWIAPEDYAKEQLGMVRECLERWQDEKPGTKEMDQVLQKLWDANLPPAAFRNSLELLFGRLEQYLPVLIGKFVGIRVPIRRRQREEIAALQATLNKFALAYEWFEGNLIGVDPATKDGNVISERIAYCLAQHIYISYLIAASVEHGIWLRLHSAGLQDQSVRNLPSSYRLAILLAAIQPNSFASRELAQLLPTLAQYADEVRLEAMPPASPEKMERIFWIAPERDLPPFAMNRREPLPEDQVFYFDGTHIAAKLMAESKAEPKQNLRKSILQRAAQAIDAPGRRLFPRRRRRVELRRAVIHVGLESFWAQLLRERGQAEKTGNEAEGQESSYWMIVNESLNGYALMLLNGKVNSIRVGDAIALRTSEEQGWMVCLARWVRSNNQEHLEMGVEVVALKATPAMIYPMEEDIGKKLPLLLLPEHPPLREAEGLLAPSGVLVDERYRLWLATGDAGEERVVRFLESTQNSRTELFTVAMYSALHK